LDKSVVLSGFNVVGDNGMSTTLGSVLNVVASRGVGRVYTFVFVVRHRVIAFCLCELVQNRRKVTAAMCFATDVVP
jgi:hypothetical protein